MVVVVFRASFSDIQRDMSFISFPLSERNAVFFLFFRIRSRS